MHQLLQQDLVVQERHPHRQDRRDLSTLEDQPDLEALQDPSIPGGQWDLVDRARHLRRRRRSGQRGVAAAIRRCC